jgi:hypothetical protein
MKFTTLTIAALGFVGLAVSQATGTSTIITTRPCLDPKKCSPVCTPPTRSNAYTSKTTTDSTDLTRSITEHRRQVPSATCTVITSIRSDDREWPPPISTHTTCAPEVSSPCSTSYECGCNSTTFTLDEAPKTILCQGLRWWTVAAMGRSVRSTDVDLFAGYSWK